MSLFGILILGFNESILGYIKFYRQYSVDDLDSTAYDVMIVLLTVIRSVYARVLVLVVALGYQIVLKSILKYHAKIGIVTFLYAVSLLVSLIV